MRQFVRRNDFTKIFGGIGRRRTKKSINYILKPKRFHLMMVRRGHIGWRNKTWSRLSLLKIRIRFGVYPPGKKFRR